MNSTHRYGPLCWRAARTYRGNSALLLDRDGVINQKIENGYVLDYDRDFRFVPHFLSCARRFADAGIPLVVVSNQSCIGRSLISADAMQTIMRRMIDDLQLLGIPIAGYAICPHAPAEGCNCRKPSAGLLHAAASLLDLHMWNCAMIGDSATDIAAADAAGCPGMLVDAADCEAYKSRFRDAFSYIVAGIAA